MPMPPPALQIFEENTMEVLSVLHFFTPISHTGSLSPDVGLAWHPAFLHCWEKLRNMATQKASSHLVYAPHAQATIPMLPRTRPSLPTGIQDFHPLVPSYNGMLFPKHLPHPPNHPQMPFLPLATP